MRRGFLLGKFMPPHAGHVALWDAALRLVDQLTILVCSLPDDPISGEIRLQWIRDLAPRARAVGYGEQVPQAPEDSPEFWPIWERIVHDAHPERIDLVFAGEAYGAELASRVGGTFVGLGARIMGVDREGLGGLSASRIRADPWANWRWLPPPVRAYYSRTVCLHGVESTGKTMLADRLAAHFDTIAVAEFGRIHCEIHGTDCQLEDLLLIGGAQQAMIEAAKPWCNRVLFSDTDPLMTAAWSQMMIGEVPKELLEQPKADLYLLLDADAPWIDDGTRLYGSADRERFHKYSTDVLERANVRFERISGDWDARFERAVALVEALGPRRARSELFLSNR